MRNARTIKFRGGSRIRSMRGGAMTNIEKLEEDFAKQVTMGKSDVVPNGSMNQFARASSDTIKKKFSI